MKKKTGAEPKKRGPKSKFCPELLGRVCGRVEGGETVKEAVKLEGMGLSQFYERVGEKPEMAEALRKARMAKGLEILEAEAYRRALEGDVVPVYRKGKLVGEVRKYSDRMLMVLLTAHAPAKYGKRRGKGDELTPEEEKAKIAEMVARFRQINEQQRVMVEEFVARGKAQEAAAATALKEDAQTRRCGDLEKGAACGASSVESVGSAGSVGNAMATMAEPPGTKADQEHDHDHELGGAGVAVIGQEAKTDPAHDENASKPAGATGGIPELPEPGPKAPAGRSLEDLEDEAFRRAMVGVEKPIFQAGKQVGVVRQRSDRLLIFLLAALGPARYGRGKKEEPKLVNHPVYGSFNTHPDLVREYERNVEICQPILDHWKRWFKLDEYAEKKAEG